MQYQEIHEAAAYYIENGDLQNTQPEHQQQLLSSALNYLCYGTIDNDYICVLELVEWLMIKNPKSIKNCLPLPFPIVKNTAKHFAKAYASITKGIGDCNEADIQVALSGLLSVDRVKHSASQYGDIEISQLSKNLYESNVEKFKGAFPEHVSPETAFLAIARLNRFQIIYDYMVEKFKVKYSPRVPRLDDFCKMLSYMKKTCNQNQLANYLDRFDTAKFEHVSIYSPWNVCYYRLLRNALLSLPDKKLEKQLLSFRSKIKKIDPKKLGKDELIVFKDVKSALK